MTVVQPQQDTLPDQAAAVLRFWYDEAGPSRWFSVDPTFDMLLRSRFALIHAAARQCELWPWRQTPAGRVAEIIVLDQFSRNLFRGQSQAFAADPLALALAQEAVHQGVDTVLPLPYREFLYMPYMHSESLAIHEQALSLFNQPGLETRLHYERRHLDILERFGRYPHRNTALGRESTPAELAFLEMAGSGF